MCSLVPENNEQMRNLLKPVPVESNLLMHNADLSLLYDVAAQKCARSEYVFKFNF